MFLKWIGTILFLVKQQKSMINRHAINFLDRLEDYKELGYANQSWSYLLLGPPGTGKTLCCSILINLV